MKHIVEEWMVPQADRNRDDLKIFKTNAFTSSILGILPLSAVDAYSREHWQLKANFKWLESLFLPSKLMCRFSKHSSKIPPVFPDWISSRRDPMCAKAHDKCNLSIWTWKTKIPFLQHDNGMFELNSYVHTVKLTKWANWDSLISVNQAPEFYEKVMVRFGDCATQVSAMGPYLSKQMVHSVFMTRNFNKLFQTQQAIYQGRQYQLMKFKVIVHVLLLAHTHNFIAVLLLNVVSDETLS